MKINTRFIAFLFLAGQLLGCAHKDDSRVTLAKTQENTEAPHAPALKEIPFTVVDSGPISGIEKLDYKTIRTVKDFNRLWDTLKSHAPDKAATPSVDFSSEMVMAILLGNREKSGYDIKIDRVIDENKRAVVDMTITEPAEECISAQIITSPYVIIKTPALSKPVVYRFRRDSKKCS